MIVYLITNKINGKRYVGQTVQLLNVRWSKHCHVSNANKGMLIVHAIQKYGRDSFEIKVLSKCSSLEEMNYRERYYIKLLKTSSPNGYNILPGGLNSLHTEETKKKIYLNVLVEKNILYLVSIIPMSLKRKYPNLKWEEFLLQKLEKNFQSLKIEIKSEYTALKQIWNMNR